MKFAICNELFEGWSWREVCQYAASLGYDAVELAPFTVAADARSLDAGARRAIRQDASAAGVEIAGLHWLLMSPPGLELLAADPAQRREATEYLCALASFCADIGGQVMVLGSPRQRNRPADVPDATAQAWLRDQLHVVAQKCAAVGVTLCLEPLPAPDTNVVNTLEQAAEVVAAVQHPALALILDVKSMGADPTPTPQLIHQYGPLARHVHANDVNLRGPGDGPTDFVPILRALAEMGYDGYVSVEVFDFTPDARTVASGSLAALQDALRRGAQAERSG